jgi:hypothetical protein
MMALVRLENMQRVILMPQLLLLVMDIRRHAAVVSRVKMKATGNVVVNLK